MTTEEWLDEIEWFLDAGIHPWTAAEQVGKVRNTVLQAARRFDRTRIREAFIRAGQDEQDRIKFTRKNNNRKSA
jgi:hypothetical protein